MNLNPQLAAHVENHISLLQGWCTNQKGCRLAEIVADNNLERVLEIGVFGGRSLIPMALAMRWKGKGRVYGVDPWAVVAATEGSNAPEDKAWWANKVNLEEIYQGFITHVQRHELIDWCHWFRVDSMEALKLFPDGWGQLIHLDANHSEETSCRDVRAWMPKLATDGWFVMDDTNWESQRKAIQLLLDSGFQKVEDYDSWAVFRRLQPQALEPLLGAPTTQ